MSAVLLLLVALGQTPAQEPASSPQHAVFESVIHDRGKPIGTTIMLNVSGSQVTGWLQKHDYFPIDSGQVTETGYTIHAAGNTYQLNTRTGRLLYGGPDGQGDSRLNRMEAVVGRVYQIREETDEGREFTLETQHGNQMMLVDQEPAIWKNSGPPIARFHLDRLEEILGKTVTVWRTRTGGAWSLEVIEEPAGMDIPAKLVKEKEKKKKS